MRWTKLKQITEERFAPSVRDRVQVGVTRYRRAHDAEGRWDVTIDGVQVGGLGCIVAEREESEAIAQLQAASGGTARQVQGQAQAMLAGAGDRGHAIRLTVFHAQ